jgi:hypothetical protein
VQSPAMIVVNQHTQELQAEAVANRLANQAKNARGESRAKVAAAVSSLRSLLGPPPETPLALPKLSDYPYRS